MCVWGGPSLFSPWVYPGNVQIKTQASSLTQAWLRNLTDPSVSEGANNKNTDGYHLPTIHFLPGAFQAPTFKPNDNPRSRR